MRIPRLLFSLAILLIPTSLIRAETITVPAGGDLQAALNAAKCGDLILLQAGATWDAAPGKSFEIPNKSCTAGVKTVLRTSASSALPNARVSPADTANMARVRGRGNAAFYFAPGASGWVFDGLEITNTGADSEFVSTLIDGTDETLRDLTIMRSLIHPKETGTDYSRSVNRAVYFNGDTLLFKWNYASGFMGVSTTDGSLMTSAVFLTVKGRNITIEDNYLEAWYAAIFTGGGQTLPEFTSTISGASTTSAAFLTPSGLAAGTVVRFELHGLGTLSGNVLIRTSGESLDVGDVTKGPGANAVWLKAANGTFYRFGLSAVSGNTYTLSPFNGGAPAGNYEWTCFQTAIVTSVSGQTVNYAPYGVNQLRHSPTGQAAWRVTPIVRNVNILRNTFNIDVANAEWAHNKAVSGFEENPKGWWEFKDATDVLIEGNRFTGYPSTMGMVPRSDEGVTPWSTMNRITVRSNLFDLTAEPAGEREWFIASGDDNYNSSTPGGSFTFSNNLVINVNSLGFVRTFRNSNVTHNTIINRPNAVYGSAAWKSDVNTNNSTILRDNVFANNEYGIVCLDQPGGINGCWPGLTFLKNVIVNNANGGNIATQYGIGLLSPVVTTFADVGFVDPNSKNYALNSTSAYKGLASDGTDPGVNMAALLAALSGAVTNPSPTPIPTPSVSPSASPVVSPTPQPTPTPPISAPTPKPPKQACEIGKWCYWDWPTSQNDRVNTLNNAVLDGCDRNGPWFQTGSYMYCLRAR